MANANRDDLLRRLVSNELMAVVPIVAPTLVVAAKQWQESVVAGADLVEWRLDLLSEGEWVPDEIETAARHLRSEFKVPVLATWRTVHEGGSFGSESEYADLVRATARWADLVDVEIDRVGGAELIRELGDEAIVVASHHRFNPPVDGEHLRSRLNQMRDHGAAVAKVASMVGSNEDLREILAVQDWAATLLVPTVVIGMGPGGRETRVGNRARASAFAFATVQGSSAPGQPTLGELRASV